MLENKVKATEIIKILIESGASIDMYRQSLTQETKDIIQKLHVLNVFDRIQKPLLLASMSESSVLKHGLPLDTINQISTIALVKYTH
jgi:hypothetical protein